MKGECFICGRWRDLDKHHIFGASNRLMSERLGLYVYLCRGCHTVRADSVHKSAETMQKLHEYGQRKAMREQGWDIAKFRTVFHANYLDLEKESNNENDTEGKGA